MFQKGKSGGFKDVDFLRAARAGDLSKVMECLKEGTDINTANSVSLAYRVQVLKLFP